MSLVPTYDPSVDATVELDPRVLVDRDADGIAVGVELLGAARHGIPTGLLADALGEGADEQEIADAALSAIRGRPSAAGPD